MAFDLLKGSHPIFNMYPFLKKILYFLPFVWRASCYERDLIELFCILCSTLIKVPCILYFALIGALNHNFCACCLVESMPYFCFMALYDFLGK